MVAAAGGGIYFIAPCHISLFKFPIHTCLHHYLIHPVMHLPLLVSFHPSILKSQSYYKHTCNTIHRISSPSISCTLPLLSHIVRLCSTPLLTNALSYSLLSKVVHTLFPPFPKFGFPVWTIIRALFSNLYHYPFDTLCSFYYSVVVVEIQQVEAFWASIRSLSADYGVRAVVEESLELAWRLELQKLMIRHMRTCEGSRIDHLVVCRSSQPS